MNKDFYSKSSQLAKEYWDFYKRYERYKDARKDIEKIQEIISQLEKRKKKYIEKSIMRSRMEEQIQKLKLQTSIVSDVERTFKKKEQELLELTATSFEIDPKNEQTLSEDYIRALTHLFLGESKEIFEFHECVITPKGVDVTNDETKALMICVNICDFIRNATNERLGKTSIIKERALHYRGKDGTKTGTA